VHVTLPFTTLIGADDQPCELAGYGPIPADLAREIAADGVWKRLLFDPLSGAVLDHGRTTYRPPAALADFVRARDARCRFPTCQRQAGNCELDHVQPWTEGGVTADHNLANGCVHHHHTKHQPGWTVRMRADGLLEWITPTGHHYLGNPHDYRPLDDPDPPLLHRRPGKDPVPERLGDEAAPNPRGRVRCGAGLSDMVMFGRYDGAGPDRPPPDPADLPPF
jgi:hypothetical protein